MRGPLNNHVEATSVRPLPLNPTARRSNMHLPAVVRRRRCAGNDCLLSLTNGTTRTHLPHSCCCWTYDAITLTSKSPDNFDMRAMDTSSIALWTPAPALVMCQSLIRTAVSLSSVCTVRSPFLNFGHGQALHVDGGASQQTSKPQERTPHPSSPTLFSSSWRRSCVVQRSRRAVQTHPSCPMPALARLHLRSGLSSPMTPAHRTRASRAPDQKTSTSFERFSTMRGTPTRIGPCLCEPFVHASVARRCTAYAACTR